MKSLLCDSGDDAFSNVPSPLEFHKPKIETTQEIQ
jgi:hypothetical protein